MTQNNNTSVLPFYTSMDEWNSRRSYAYGQIYPLYTPTTKILPFQVIMTSGWWGTLTSAVIKKLDGTTLADITTAISTDLVKVAKTNYDVLACRAFTQFTEQPEGQYYLEMTDGTRTLYSEVFTMVKVLTPYVKIQWWDDSDLECDGWGIVYETGGQYLFVNTLYLNTQIGKPEYVFEEDGETRDGYFFPEKQISEKTYKCTILAPEYLCDVMRFIRMSDHISITDNYGRTYAADTFLITPKWEDQGDLASVEIEFQTQTVAKKIGRAYSNS